MDDGPVRAVQFASKLQGVFFSRDSNRVAVCCVMRNRNLTEIGENVFRFKYFAPNAGFRTQFEYNNWMIASLCVFSTAAFVTLYEVMVTMMTG